MDKRDWKRISLIFIIALLLRLSFMFLLHQRYTSEDLLNQKYDPGEYVGVAEYLIGLRSDYENGLLIRGVGYPLFIATSFLLLGYNAWSILLPQVIISSVTCVLIYLIAREVIGNHYNAAFMAGLLAAFSLTSISLSVNFLSETLFQVLVVYSFYLLVKGFKCNNLLFFIASGVFSGYASLVRMTNVLWPCFIIMAIFIMPKYYLPHPKKDILLKCGVFTIITLLFVGCWSERNFLIHGIFTPATNGAYLAVYYWTASSFANEINVEGQSIFDLPGFYQATINPTVGVIKVREYWRTQLGILPELDDNGELVNCTERYKQNIRFLSKAITEHPVFMACTFIKNIVINTLEIDYFHQRIIRPIDKNLIIEIRIFLQFFSIVIFILFWSSLLLYWQKVHDFTIPLLLTVYLFFAFMSGFGFWQGSRYFFPGEFSWMVLIPQPLLSFFIFLRKYLNL